MNEISREKKEEIARILRERGVVGQCPMCRSTELTLLGHYSHVNLQADTTRTVLGGLKIPVVNLLCGSCGYLMQHALGQLGLLTKKETKND